MCLHTDVKGGLYEKKKNDNYKHWKCGVTEDGLPWCYATEDYLGKSDDQQGDNQSRVHEVDYVEHHKKKEELDDRNILKHGGPTQLIFNGILT